MAGLDDFVPEPRVVQVRGKVVEIWPMQMAQGVRCLRKAQAILPMIAADNLTGAVLDQYEALRDAVAIAAKVEADWLDGLLSDDFLALTVAVMEVNWGFFTQSLRPQIMAAAGRMNGALSLPGSSPEATPPMQS